MTTNDRNDLFALLTAQEMTLDNAKRLADALDLAIAGAHVFDDDTESTDCRALRVLAETVSETIEHASDLYRQIRAASHAMREQPKAAPAPVSPAAPGAAL